MGVLVSQIFHIYITQFIPGAHAKIDIIMQLFGDWTGY